MSKSEMKERQTLENEYMQRKMKIHHISYLVAIERYAVQFERLWDTFKDKT